MSILFCFVKEGWMALQKTTKKDNFLTGAFVLVLANALVKIIGAIFKIPLTNLFGKEGMGIFNGDMGIIHQINSFTERVTVIFDENRRVEYPFSGLDELELAYAITIHKSQGSEYPAVVLPLLHGPSILCNRNLLYTAVTRAQKCVAIVGRKTMVEQMIRNETEQKRYTGLKECLKEYCLKE